MKCERCDKEIEPDRLRVLPETRICAACAKALNPPRAKGAMIWENKTAPTIQIMSAETYENVWKPMNPKYGRGSAVHKISKPTSSM